MGFPIVFCGVFFYLKSRKSEDFEPLIKAKLQQLVNDGSDGLYVLDLDSVEVDVLNSRATVHNVRLSVDTAKLKVLSSEAEPLGPKAKTDSAETARCSTVNRYYFTGNPSICPKPESLHSHPFVILRPDNPDYTARDVIAARVVPLSVPLKTSVFKPIRSGSGTPVHTGRFRQTGR